MSRYDLSAAYATEAERALVAAALVDPAIAGWCDVEPRQANDPAARAVWSALRTLSASGRGIDEVTLEEQLRRDGTLDAVGGLAAVSGWYGLPQMAATYADSIRSAWLTRQVLTVCGRATREVEAGVYGDELRDELIGELDRLSVERRPEVTTLGQAVRDSARRALDATAELDLVPTGVPGIELPVATTTTLAARPSVGKTALILELVAGVVRARGDHGVILLYEDRALTLGRRKLADVTGIDGSALRRRELDLEQHRRVRAVADAGELGARPELDRVHVVHCHGRPVEWAIRQVKALAHRHPLGAVALDYAQKVAPSDRRANRDQQVEHVANSFDALVAHLECVGILASQLNRECERENREPRMSDMRNSGALEQISKMGLLLHELDSGALRVIGAKNSEGQKGGAVDLGYDRAHQRFFELPDRPMHGEGD